MLVSSAAVADATVEARKQLRSALVVQRKSAETKGKAATEYDLFENPYSLEKVGRHSSERDKFAKALYENNLREMTRIMSGPRGFWMVRMNKIGAFEDCSRCKISDKPAQDHFTVYMPGPGQLPRFGHTRMLNEYQLNVFPTIQKDANLLALAKERAHVAMKEGFITQEEAEKSLVELHGRFGPLPVSTMMRADVLKAREAGLKDAERRELAEMVAEDEKHMPSFDELLSSFRSEGLDTAEDDLAGSPQAGPASADCVLAVSPNSQRKKKKKKKKKPKEQEAGCTLCTIEGRCTKDQPERTRA